VHGDRYILRRFQRHVGDLYLTSLTPEHVAGFFDVLLREHRTSDGVTRPPVAASTYNQLRKRITAFCDYLTRRGFIRTDLMAHVGRPLPVAKRQRLQVTPQVIWAMLDSASDMRTRTILSTAINTGLRANELAELRVGDVDLDALNLQVRISKSHLEEPMPLTGDLAEDLRAWLEEYAAWQVARLGRIRQTTDYLFPARIGPRYVWTVDDATGEKVKSSQDLGFDPLRPAKRLHLIAQDALRAVGLPYKGEGIHTLRRSAARALYDSLVASGGHEHAVRVVSTFLHHSNIATTEHYIGVKSERRIRDLHLRGKSLLGPRPTSAEIRRIH
jgi:integrase